jgi:uncharacterized protein (DUF488 family)
MHDARRASEPRGDEPRGSRLWTIGHSTRSLDEFLALLGANAIERVVDVRRYPGSRKYPHFNSEKLGAALEAAGIGYTPMPELGGRRTPRPDSPHTEWRNEAFRGYADYMDTPAFAAAAAELARIAERERVAIMCSEAVWWRCHRSMIADWFTAHGWLVMHITSTAAPKPHPVRSIGDAAKNARRE